MYTGMYRIYLSCDKIQQQIYCAIINTTILYPRITVKRLKTFIQKRLGRKIFMLQTKNDKPPQGDNSLVLFQLPRSL